MHEGQVLVTTDQVAALVAAQFPELAGAPIRPLDASGTVNVIFRIGASHTARFPLVPSTPAEDVQRLREEQAAMAHFADVATTSAPAPVGIGAPGAGYPTAWSIQTWIDGSTASTAEPHTVAVELAALVRRLRAASTDGRRFDRSGRGGDLRDHDRWVETCLAHAAHLVDVDLVRSEWTALRDLPRGAADAMSHGDLIPGNVLVEGGHLVGVLDTGGFGPADPALDTVAAWHLFDREARSAFRDALGCSDLDWARGRAWALEQALGAAWYYEHTNRSMHTLGMSTLQRVLDAGEVK